MDPWNTQVYLEREWGFAFFSEVVRVPSKLQVWDFNDPAFGLGVEDGGTWRWEGMFGMGDDEREQGKILDANVLAMQLLQEAVCFREGPRFLKKHIDDAARLFQQMG